MPRRASLLSCAQQSSATAQKVGTQLDRMFKSGSGISTVATSLKDDINKLVSGLTGVYRSQLTAASNVLSAGSNAAVSQVRGRGSWGHHVWHP